MTGYLIPFAALTALAAQPAADGAPAAVVTMPEMAFEPNRVTVRAGETVEWRNDSDIVHTVTADPARAKDPEKSVALPEGAETFHSGRMKPGDVFRHTFTVPGHYRYFCVPHERMGMIGEVEVTPADPAGGGEQAAGHGHEAHTHGEGDHAHARAHGGAHLPTFLEWLGKFHPAVVAFPGALLVAAALAELLLIATGRPLFDAAARFCLWFGGLTAPLAGVLGWFFAGFEVSADDWVLSTHRWLGTATAAVALLALILGEASRRPGAGRAAYRLVLFAAAGLVIATGYFGGSMIYGLNHFAWPE